MPNAITSRLSQGSTYAGLGALILGAKFFLPPQWGPVVDAVAALMGSVAVAVDK